MVRLFIVLNVESLASCDGNDTIHADTWRQTGIAIMILFYFFAQCAFPNVAATTRGNTKVASAYTLTDSAPARILPHETASSGLAPESDPSNSCPVLMYTA